MRGSMISGDREIAWGLIIYGTGNDYLGFDTHKAAKTAEWGSHFFKMSYSNERAKCYWQSNVSQLFFIYKDEYLNKINLVWRDLFYSYSTKMEEKVQEFVRFLDGFYNQVEIYRFFEPIIPYLNQPNANKLLQYEFAERAGLKSESFKYYKLSADQGHCDAQYNVAQIMEKNNPTDLKEALSYYLLAANQGHDNAQYSAGRIYQGGFESDVPVDMSKAIHYYKLAVDQKHNLAVVRLTDIYKEDAYLNLEEAFNIALNFPSAHREFLGFCFEEGVGGLIDHKNAFISYGGFRGLITHRVAYCHENGIGTKMDLEKALKLYKTLADRGRDSLDFSVDQGSDIKNSTHLLADVPLYIEACFKAASWCENGTGGQPDRPEALKYYHYLDEVSFALVAIYKLGKAYKNSLNDHQNLKKYFTYNHFQRHKLANNDIENLTGYWFMLGQTALMKIAKSHYEAAVQNHSEDSLQKSVDYYKKARNNLISVLGDVPHFEMRPFSGSDYELGEMLYYKQSCIRLMNQFSNNPLINL